MISLQSLTYCCCAAVAFSAVASSAVAAQPSPPSVPSAESSSGTVAFQIEPQSVGAALKAFAAQAGMQLVYESGAVSAASKTSGLTGAFTPSEALRRLLAHTNLDYKFINSRTVSIRSADDTSSSKPPQGPNSPATKQTISDASSASETELEEVIVTAQKRQERLQDVPVPVTAISADSLVDSGQVQLQQYSTRIPGLNVTPDDYGAAQLTIRGLSSQGATPTVAVLVDDVPFGSSTGLASGAEVPDIDPGDLARVEVLRGPQGTLYGASSLGGLLKFVTVDPSTDGFSGHVQAGTSEIHNGNELGYNFRGSVNVPLTDDVAMRASAFTREDAGYVNNPILGVDGVNQSRTSGARLAALWRASDSLTIKLSALFQDRKANGLSDVLPMLGDLNQSYLPGVGGSESKTQAYSMTLTDKFGAASVTAVSGYSVSDFRGSIDFTSLYGPTIDALFGVPGTEVINHPRTSRFTQELRVSVPLGDRLEWLLGGFYDHERSPSSESILAVDPGTGAQVGTLETIDYPSAYTEYAGFTDLTLRISDPFDIQLGGRESENKQSYQQSTYYGAEPIGDIPPSSLINPKQTASGNSFTYLLTPRYKLSPDLMLYARFASGYRPGGPNYNVQQYGLPPTYSPDKTQNYEVGFKGDILDKVLSFDTSLYYIKWRNIQLALLDPVSGQGYFANAGDAKSQGLEISLESHPVSGMTLAGWVAWNEAVLTQNFPATSTAAGGSYGLAGDRLPNTSRFSGNLALDQQFPLTQSVVGTVGASVSYLGNSLGIFQPTAQRQVFPEYARTDVHAGARYESWLINIFVNNVADRRAIVGGGLGYYNASDFQYIQPRTIGLSIDKRF